MFRFVVDLWLKWERYVSPLSYYIFVLFRLFFSRIVSVLFILWCYSVLKVEFAFFSTKMDLTLLVGTLFFNEVKQV